MGFTTSYASVTWTAGDVITEAKLDNMVANDQAYNSHAAQGLELDEMSKPSNPASGKLRIYAKDKDGVSTLYYLKDDGTEVEIGVSSNGSSGIFRQAIVNGGCEVNQAVTAVSLTDGKLFGSVDMFYAKGAGTAVSAGTIGQATAANVGNSGYALKLAGVTISGTGIVHAYTFIESKNAKLYKNKTASFSVKVYHDVGSAIDYTIKINKADSEDDFSAVTNIDSADAQSVPNTTETEIKFENVDLGDCSNGIEIEIMVECGAITTKNFEFGDWQFNEGETVSDFVCKNYQKTLWDCYRYLYAFVSVATLSPVGYGFASTTTVARIYCPLPMEMLKTPTLVGTASDFELSDGVSAGIDLTDIGILGLSDGKVFATTIQATVASGLTQYRTYLLRANNSENKILLINARPTIA